MDSIKTISLSRLRTTAKYSGIRKTDVLVQKSSLIGGLRMTGSISGLRMSAKYSLFRKTNSLV